MFNWLKRARLLAALMTATDERGRLWAPLPREFDDGRGDRTEGPRSWFYDRWRHRAMRVVWKYHEAHPGWRVAILQRPPCLVLENRVDLESASVAALQDALQARRDLLVARDAMVRLWTALQLRLAEKEEVTWT